jgi:hypothetical protein
MTMELVEEPGTSRIFDYRDGAHYKVKMTYTGQNELRGDGGGSAGIGFVLFTHSHSNDQGLTLRFNGNPGPYGVELEKAAPVATIAVSISPPANDINNSFEREYSAVLQSEHEDDNKIVRTITVKPRFADLRAPHATITAPYDGQRISSELFKDKDNKPFKIQVFSEDTDVNKIGLEIRQKRSDGVWEPWRKLDGMVWEDGVTTSVVTTLTHSERKPIRKEFTFNWQEAQIKSLGVGSYALRAVASDKATRLSTDKSKQEPKPNVDLDPPIVTFEIDGSKPTVLTTTPFYQDRESQRIYRGELSATFNDDMRTDDFSDRTFEVIDLLNGSAKIGGFVSYSPALRQAVFVPIVPLQPNGFFKAEVKTDSGAGKGVHDLAGNPLDVAFSWTFRTADTPFEETWSITLSVTDGASTDANNIAAVAFGAKDGEDEKDARAVPRVSSQIGLSFVDANKVEFDRDTRPADGRLGHHWFFNVAGVANGQTVTINWKPSLKLTRTMRQYQVINLVEFNQDKTVANTVALNPVGVDLAVGAEAYTFTATDQPRFFRLDVMKANLVATKFVNGSSGWKFFSVPIKPDVEDPFVNLGDDIDPFQMFMYDTKENGYKVYPLDIGRVSLQTEYGYFTRLVAKAVEVDVGGASNNSDVTLTLDVAGWHAIGNPFILPVNVADLK